MYIRVVSLHSEASVCRERERRERGKRGRKRERESECVCVSVRGRLSCRSCCTRPSATRCCIAGLQELAGADLGVVLCESDKGFKGL
jgi:hypothetical protein